jgi:hypothetical protein
MSITVNDLDAELATLTTTSDTPPIAKLVPNQFSRLKGAKWFNIASQMTVLILGQGGIGSWLSLFMTRLGTTIHIWDFDRYEEHNMSGQLVRNEDMGKYKTQAIHEILCLLNNNPVIYTNEIQYSHESYSGDIVMCAFDNMDARKVAFHKWKADLEGGIKLKKDHGKFCFFQDGRLNAEQFQIINIPGDRPDLMEKYESEYLFDDAVVEEVDCTFKQTSHCAAMIAAHMTGFYTNWLTNVQENDPKYSQLPFFFEYVVPFNMINQDYANT